MNGNKINWDKVKRGSDVDILAIYYSSLEVFKQLQSGVTIEDLFLNNGKEQMVSEGGFKEYIKLVVSLPWLESSMSEQEITALNQLVQYVQQNSVQEAESSGGVSIQDLINSSSNNGS